MRWNRVYSKPNLHSITTGYVSSGRLPRQPNGVAREILSHKCGPDYRMPNTINSVFGYSHRE